MDLDKVYDGVNREALRQVLRRYDVGSTDEWYQEYMLTV